MKRKSILYAVLAPFFIASAATANSLIDLTAIELTDKQKQGKMLYGNSCIYCHGNEGTGDTGISLINALETGRALSKIERDMPPLQSNFPNCDAECADKIVSWLEHVNDINTDPGESDAKLIVESPADTYRRASILLGKGVPSLAKMTALKTADDSVLIAELNELMKGAGFKTFIKNGANDRLLVRSYQVEDNRFWLKKYYREYDRLEALYDNPFQWSKALSEELREEPLELINYVIQTNKPYTEILTANYTLMSTNMAKLYRSPTLPAEGKWLRGKNRGQYVSTQNRFPSDANWKNATPLTQPHVGILSTMAYLNQYPSTAANRNRARSRWTMDHFLGFNIEASAPRIKLEDASDADNPTLNNKVCTVCHTTMDPIAASFQDYSDRGIFRLNKGQHSLSRDYMKSDLYQQGQTWYADVLPPGFNGQPMPAQVNYPLRWLANSIVNDERFAEATIRFWWPAIFGEALFESRSKTEVQAQQVFVAEASQRFKQSNWNFKALLTDLLMSPWFRTETVENVDKFKDFPVTYNGQRLLTPEEIGLKTQQLFNNSGHYLKSHYGAFGGIDSIEVTQRDRHLNVVKMNVLKANAFTESCSIAYQDFKKKKANRRLFNKVELWQVPGTRHLKNTQVAKQNSVKNISRFNVRKEAFNITFSQKSGDAQITYLKITDPNGKVLFNDSTANLKHTETFQVTAKAQRPKGFYRLKNAKDFLTLSIKNKNAVAGNYRIESTHIATKPANASALTVRVLEQGSASAFTDDSSKRTKQQIQHLYQQLTGVTYPLNHSEIKQAFLLFNQLRSHAEKRGNQSLAAGDNQCPGEKNVNHFDRHYTFAAWKGVLIALTTDYSFIAE